MSVRRVRPPPSPDIPAVRFAEVPSGGRALPLMVPVLRSRSPAPFHGSHRHPHLRATAVHEREKFRRPYLFVIRVRRLAWTGGSRVSPNKRHVIGEEPSPSDSATAAPGKQIFASKLARPWIVFGAVPNAKTPSCLLGAYWSDLDDVLVGNGGDPKH